jgi:hypothetical protein
MHLVYIDWDYLFNPDMWGDKEVTNNNPAKVATPDDLIETELRTHDTELMNIWPSTACH